MDGPSRRVSQSQKNTQSIYLNYSSLELVVLLLGGGSSFPSVLHITRAA